MNKGREVVKWAAENLEDFKVVSGLSAAGIGCNIRILEALHQAGLDELSEMMMLRIFELLFRDDPASMEAERLDREEFIRSKEQEKREGGDF